jgi:hypothetical protein
MIDLERPYRAAVLPSAAWLHRHSRMVIGGAALFAAATGICVLVGLSPWLPLVLAVLSVAAIRPMAGLGYAIVVLSTPLGLWAIDVQGLVGSAFGGRDYALSLSALAVVFIHTARAALRWRPSREQAIAGGVAALVLAGAALVGLQRQGIPQTLIGVRYVLFPVAVLVVVAARSVPDIVRLVGLLSWMIVANAVAAVVEFLIGPPRLAAWGLNHKDAIRYIDGNFRAPGLTDFNAELGMLAGAFLLGYLCLWLTRDARPRQRLWHAAAAAAAICLALSTSRSGAVMLVAGLVTAVTLNRSGGQASRRRSRRLGLAVVILVVIGFAVVGATAAHSLVDRLGVWGSLLRHGVPVYGLGVGAVGAASNSRVATGSRVVVDNYFVSLALQFGPVLAASFVALLVAVLIWLWRRSVDHSTYVLYIGVVAGLAASFLVIEAWEYDAAMACLAVFVGYTIKHPPPERE